MTPLSCHRLTLPLAIVAAVAYTAADPSAQMTLGIWPVTPTIASHQSSTVVWLENRGSTPLTLQVRVVGWTAVDYEEVLVDRQEDVVASPAVATLAPRQRQLVRIVRVGERPAGREQAYRVLVDELPAVPTVDGRRPEVSFGVSLRLRYSLPLFIYGDGLIARNDNGRTPGATARLAMPDLAWRMVSDGAARWLHVRNSGDGHARLGRVVLRSQSIDTLLSDGLLGYVLAGTERRWRLPDMTVDPTDLTVVANVNDRALAAVRIDAVATTARTR